MFLRLADLDLRGTVAHYPDICLVPASGRSRNTRTRQRSIVGSIEGSTVVPKLVSRKATDKTRQKATLSAPQHVALTALAAGSTVTAAAEAANVSRQTVSDWLHHDAEFASELLSRRDEQWAALRARLELITTKAVATVAELLDHEDPRIRLAAVARIFTLVTDRGRQRPNLPWHGEPIPEPADVESIRRAQESRDLFGGMRRTRWP